MTLMSTFLMMRNSLSNLPSQRRLLIESRLSSNLLKQTWNALMTSVKVSEVAVRELPCSSSVWMISPWSTQCISSHLTGTKTFSTNQLTIQKKFSLKTVMRQSLKFTSSTCTTKLVDHFSRDTSCYLLYKCSLSSNLLTERLIHVSMTSSYVVVLLWTKKDVHLSHHKIGLPTKLGIMWLSLSVFCPTLSLVYQPPSVLTLRNGKIGSVVIRSWLKMLNYLESGRLNAKTTSRRWLYSDVSDLTELFSLSETLLLSAWNPQNLSLQNLPAFRKSMRTPSPIFQSFSCSLLVSTQPIFWWDLHPKKVCL